MKERCEIAGYMEFLYEPRLRIFRVVDRVLRFRR